MDSLDPQSLAAVTVVGGALIIGAFSYLGSFISKSSLPNQDEKAKSSKNESVEKKQKKKSKKKAAKKAEPAAPVKKEAPVEPKKQVEKKKEVPKKVVIQEPKPEPVAEPTTEAGGKKKKKRNKKKKSKAQVEADVSDSSDDDTPRPAAAKKVETKPVPMTAAEVARKEGIEEEDGWNTVPLRKQKNKGTAATVPVVDATGSGKPKKVKEVRENIDLGEHVSVILGEGGNTISNIQNVSGAKVAVNKDTKTCVVSGDEESVAVAVQLIVSLMSNQAKHTMTVSSRLDKAILSKPDTKQSIRDLSGAKVEFVFGKNKDDSMTIVITGESDKVETAKSLIEAYLEGKTPDGEDGVKRVKVTGFQGRILIGQKGAQIANLQRESGASINIEFVENENVALVTVIGEPEQIERGMELIQSFLREHNLRTRVELDADARPGVLLKLNDLRREIPNLQVEVSEDRSHILLVGSGSGLSQGSRMIQEWTEKELGPPELQSGEVMEQIDLGGAAGKVIGKNKAVLNSILANAPGAKVSIKRGTLCYVHGSKSGVAKAFKDIKDIVERHEDTVAKSKLEQEELQGASWVVLGEDEESRLMTKDSKTLVAPESDWGGFKLAQMQAW